MKFIIDKLNSNYSFPCTVKEIKEFLKDLPPEDLVGIKSIRFSNQKMNNDGGYLNNGRIELIYFVDKDLKKNFMVTSPVKLLKTRNVLEEFKNLQMENHIYVGLLKT